ncbi:hypothetical protein ThvES_00005930, partial [Thiovulum sp. ES]
MELSQILEYAGMASVAVSLLLLILVLNVLGKLKAVQDELTFVKENNNTFLDDLKSKVSAIVIPENKDYSKEIAKLDEKVSAITIPETVDYSSKIFELKEQISAIKIPEITIPEAKDYSEEIAKLDEKISAI